MTRRHIVRCDCGAVGEARAIMRGFDGIGTYLPHEPIFPADAIVEDHELYITAKRRSCAVGFRSFINDLRTVTYRRFVLDVGFNHRRKLSAACF